MGQPGKNKNLTWLSPRVLLSVFFFAVLCVFAAAATPGDLNPDVSGRWYAIVPPLLAVTLAIATQKLFPALVVAVLAGGFLKTLPSQMGEAGAWSSGLVTGMGYVWNSATDTFNFQILLFVAFVMIMIAVILRSGGLMGIVKWVSKWANNARKTQFATALIGLVIFIDDYANTIIVGSTMRPLSDKHKVSREKLAFIVDATAAPIAGLAFVSTWIGYVVALLAETSRSMNMGIPGYQLFVDTLPFRFYCLLMLFFIFYIIWRGQDFGPMAKAEKRARKGKVFEDGARLMGGASETKRSDAKVDSARVALLPILFLLVYLFAGLWMDGGGAAYFTKNPLSIFSPTIWREVLIGSENNALVLAQGSFLALGLSVFLAIFTARISFGSLLESLKEGAISAIIPCAILTMAWSLKASCDGLMTGPFLVATVGDVFSPFWYPMVIFFVAALTAFSTGTSWGTMAILFPTALPIAYQLDGGSYELVLMLTVAAVLDGSILGDHCSPISDTTIMSSIGSSCDHLHHVRTQLPYALTVGAVSVGLGFVPAAMGAPSIVCLLMGAGALVGILAYIGHFKKA